MAIICKQCGEEVDELFSVTVTGRKTKVCEDCLEIIQEQAQIAEESESAIQGMMGFKGKR
ncbi:MAG: hypothetical protein GW913_06270 [Myxococcales bacterium]|nr:hypothetical protein [Myxococcales bacterium]